MKITKDILTYLDISSIYIVTQNSIHVCIPVEIEKDIWKISTDTETLKGNVIIKLKKNGKDVYFKVTIMELCEAENFTFTYKAKLKDEKEKELFLIDFAIIEQKLNNWEKRKEERYDIGFDEKKITDFGLKSFEQKIIINKQTLPCLINNISFSGAKITTIDSQFSKEKQVLLFISFINPIEQILIKGNISNLSLKEMQGQIAATLSLEFEEAPIRYKQRVADFIAKQQ